MRLDLPAKSFKLIGGALSLDFTNTVGGRDEVRSRKSLRSAGYQVSGEEISSYADLLAWSRSASLVTETEARRLLHLAESGPERAEAVLVRSQLLREVIYRVFKSVAEGWPPDSSDLEKLNDELSIAKSHERLIYSEGQYTWVWAKAGEALDSVLWAVARSAAELLTSDDRWRVRQCGGERCGWLFLDTSRNRSRQWCDMKDCGNRAKVRRFRKRLQEAPRRK